MSTRSLRSRSNKTSTTTGPSTPRRSNSTSSSEGEQDDDSVHSLVETTTSSLSSPTWISPGGTRRPRVLDPTRTNKAGLAGPYQKQLAEDVEAAGSIDTVIGFGVSKF